MKKFDQQYWDQRYKERNTGWDIGEVSTPIKEYFDQYKDKNAAILIPGAGNAYEAEYLFRKGFKDITVLDWSAEALKGLHSRFPEFPEKKLIQDDFFRHYGAYDIIVEQTFFCALHPAQRTDYVQKIHQLLKPGGKLVGLLFQIPLNDKEPPFGGTKEDYEKIFSPFFNFLKIETAYNSIVPRLGNELFIIMEKK